MSSVPFALGASAPETARIWSASTLKRADAEMTAGARNRGLAVKTISVIGIDPDSISSSVKELPLLACLSIAFSTREATIGIGVLLEPSRFVW
jgi:hypothetical protein